MYPEVEDLEYLGLGERHDYDAHDFGEGDAAEDGGPGTDERIVRFLKAPLRFGDRETLDDVM